MVTTSSSAQPLPPIERPRKKYTTFYLTLLILSTAGTTLALLGLLELPKTIGYLSTDTAYAIASLVSMCIVWPISVVALVLLWLKHPVGIWLKLGSYGVSLIATLVAVFTASGVLQKELASQLSDQATAGLSESTLMAVTNAAFYIAIVFSVIVSIAFALMWWFAYRGQAREDAEAV